MNATSFSAPLCRHPDFPAPDITDVHVTGTWDGRVLSLTYCLEGDLSAFLFPSPTTPLQTPEEDLRLWAHTCCELFLARADREKKTSADYREYNFSPSGQWAAYAFAAYRERQTPATPLPAPEFFSPCLAENRFSLSLRLPVAQGETPLPEAADDLRLGLSVVLEGADGNLSYWALRHPPGPPDFHHRDAFALTLARL
ncbi:MAG: DOMON-like domain-containing protein [Zoogloeaceae bacterium]|nr:DOMON-like domain-containing protein [Zoogloeaceae bacterium]